MAVAGLEDAVERLCLSSSSVDEVQLLIEAVCSNDSDAVRTLVEERRVDINGCRYTRLESTKMYTCPLGGAAKMGLRYMTEYLVSQGAETDQVNEFEETPLHVACNQGHFEVVQYLAQHSINIDSYNSFDCTPLLSACAEGQLEIAECLLSAGADINKTTLGLGGSALHGAALVSGSVAMTKMLLEKGLKPQPNRYGLLPILDAASKGNMEVVQFWLDYYGTDKREDAVLACNALSLVGTHFFLKNQDISKMFQYSFMSDKIRVERDLPDELFTPLEPIPVYGNVSELATKEALKQLETSHNPFFLLQHCLMLRERVLGFYHASSARPYIRYSFTLIQSGRAREVMPMWLYLMERQMEVFLSDGLPTLLIASLITLAYSLRDLATSEVDIDVFPAFQKLVLMLEKLCGNHKRKWGTCKLGLHLLSLTVKHADRYRDCVNYPQVVAAAKQFLTVSPRGPNGETLLHCAACPDITHLQTDSWHSVPFTPFPCLSTIGCLLEAGAEVNAIDKQRNTPLHLTAAADLIPSTKLSVIQLLLSAGAYPNARNFTKATPLFLCSEEGPKQLLRDATTFTLQGLAACAVVDHCVPYRDVLPRRLATFVSMH